MKNPSELFTSVTTDRFVVRVLNETDVTDFYLHWFEDADAKIHVKAARSRQTLESLRTFVREKKNSPNALLLGIFTRDTSAHIGNLKFEPIDLPAGAAVVGVLIGEPAWRNKGVFHEVFDAATDKLGSLFNVHSFWLGVAIDNPAAINAYRKAGFIRQERPPNELVRVVLDDAIYMKYQLGS